MGDTLRNAWKVSESSRTHWTDNPAHQITIASPSTLISTLASVWLNSLQAVSRVHHLLTFSARALQKVLMLDEYIIL